MDHAELVLAGIFQGRRDLLERATRHLTQDHFQSQTLRNMWIICTRYYEHTGAVVTKRALADMLGQSGAQPGQIAIYGEVYDALLMSAPQDHEFLWSLRSLQDSRAEELTGRALASSLEQLRNAAEPPKGMEGMSSHQRARAVAQEEFSRIDRELAMADSPEGDVRHEAQEILADYAQRVAMKASGRAGISFGISEVDYKVGGLQNGDLVLIPAFTSQGKSQFVTQLAWHASVMQGRNVFFATSETIRPQVRRRLIARHSRMPQFNMAEGLNTRDLKAGTLTEVQEMRLRDVVADLTSNQAYGRLHLAQIPRGATIGVLEARLAAAQRLWDIDAVVIDYLALLSAERQRDSGWQEGSDLLKSAKQVAVTFADGRGVPVISPWQMSRAAYERAQKTGAYGLADLSETAEAEKSSDLIPALLRIGDALDPRRIEMRLQILKNRDGETSEGIPLTADYTTCYFASPSAGQGVADLLDS